MAVKVNLSELSNLIDLLRAKGVVSFSSESISLNLGKLPGEAQAAANPIDLQDVLEPKPEELLYFSAGGMSQDDIGPMEIPE